MNIFKLRIGRGPYWIGVVALIGIGAGLDIVAPDTKLGGAMLAPWLFLYASRLHDFGRGGLLAVLVFVATVVIAVGGAFLNAEALAYVMQGAGEPPSQGGYIGLVALLGAIILANLGFTIWVGVVKGDPGPNRYGPQPKAAARRD